MDRRTLLLGGVAGFLSRAAAAQDGPPDRLPIKPISTDVKTLCDSIKKGEVRTLQKADYPELFEIMDELRHAAKEKGYISANTVQPSLCLVQGDYLNSQDIINAGSRFTDRFRFIYCTTEQLLQLKDREELKASVAHEYAHLVMAEYIKNAKNNEEIAAVLNKFLPKDLRAYEAAKERAGICLPESLSSAAHDDKNCIQEKLIAFQKFELATDALALELTANPSAMISMLRKGKQSREDFQNRDIPPMQINLGGGWTEKMTGTHPTTLVRIRTIQDNSAAVGLNR